jgi:hypothetical protein
MPRLLEGKTKLVILSYSNIQTLSDKIVVAKD